MVKGILVKTNASIVPERATDGWTDTESRQTDRWSKQQTCKNTSLGSIELIDSDAANHINMSTMYISYIYIVDADTWTDEQAASM